MKNKLFVLTFFLVLNVNFVSAQDWGRYWCFGDSAGINFSDLSNPTMFTTYLDCAQSNTSIGDSLNGLLMYAHMNYWPYYLQGIQRQTVIHNSSHQIMINGDSLIGIAFHNGLIFIPKPDNDSVFYLFQYGFNQSAGLYYSVIEPYFNNNQGRVIQKNVSLPLTIPQLQWGLLGVKHGNGSSWWIISRNGFQSNKFNVFLVTPDSVLGPYEQNIGTVTSTDAGMLSISKQGDKIALVNSSGFIETYTFDRCTGIIGNPITFAGQPFSRYFGCEFSPNGNLLYVSNSNNIFGGDSLRLYQFDLTQPNPGSTLQVIYQEPVPASGGLLKRGPDDKIYFTCLYEFGWPYPDSCRNIYNENLGVIHNPNNAGLSCNFAPFSFYLGGKRTYWNLPNNPNFLLGPLAGSPCDTLFSSLNEPGTKEVILIYPNPVNDHLNIDYVNQSDYKIRIIDVLGVEMFTKTFSGKNQTINLSLLNTGIYFIIITSTKEKIVKRFVKE